MVITYTLWRSWNSRCFFSEKTSLKCWIVHLQILWHLFSQRAITKVIEETISHGVLEQCVLFFIIVDFGKRALKELVLLSIVVAE